MRALLTTLAVLALVVAAYAGGAAGKWFLDEAQTALKLEIQVDATGSFNEVEYHVSPDDVPQLIKDNMNALYPEGEFVGAEKEYDEGRLCWELTKETGGLEVEVMFWADGRLHSSERQIPEAEVPEAVRQYIQNAYPTGTVTSWEVITNGQNQVVEYHVKVDDGGRKHKVLVTPTGGLIGVYYEIVAEIEVPAPPR